MKIGLVFLACLFLSTGCHLIEGEDSCFAAGTLVWTPNGDTPIEELKVGDAVYAFDHATNDVVASQVEKVWVHSNKKIDAVMLPTGRAFKVTGNHPIYDATTGRYEQARKLNAESSLLVRATRSAPGMKATATSTALLGSAPQFAGRATVYNITVAQHQNYFAEGVLVHNKSPACSPEFPQFCDCDTYPGSEPCDDPDAGARDAGSPDVMELGKTH